MSSDSTHGHTVLNYILAHGSVDVTELKGWAHREQGDRTLFHTCSVQGLSFDALLQFFIDRGKVTLSGSRVSACREHICTHEESQTDSHSAAKA